MPVNVALADYIAERRAAAVCGDDEQLCEKLKFTGYPFETVHGLDAPGQHKLRV